MGCRIPKSGGFCSAVLEAVRNAIGHGRAGDMRPQSLLRLLMRPDRLVVWLIVSLPWIFIPWTAQPFLLPKTALWQVGMLLIVIWTLFRSLPERASFRNPWVAWWLTAMSGLFAWHFWR